MSNAHPTLPSDPAQLARLAFGSLASGVLHATAVGRHLALLPLETLDLDLADPEQRRFGDYELLEKIGQGGMGVVYRARQHSLERDVAIKLLAAGPWASEEFVARFRREAQSAARMQHPNIVEIYEIGQFDALNYFAMRLVRGHTLAQELTRPEPFDPRRAAKLLRTIAEAVDYAHRLGVLHLDLKPGNVLIDARGEPLVADFGLARRVDDSAGADGDEVSGTPSYMAPEQAQLRSHRLSAATDIYGLGAILYELLTGAPPFLGATAQQTLQRVVTDDVVRPRAIRRALAPDLEAICLKCLQKHPTDRYSNARALADDLGNYLEGRAVSVRSPDLWERAQRWWAQHKTEVAMFALLLVGILGTTKEWLRADAALVKAREQQGLADERASRNQQLALHSERLNGLLVQAFPVPTDRASTDVLRAAASRIVAWLGREMPDDEPGQAALLEGLIDALEAAANPAAAGALLPAVVEELGKAHRRSAAERLVTRGSPRDLMLAAVLLQGDATAAGQALELLRRAVAAAPGDVDILAIATLYCGKSACPDARPGPLLAAAQPGNAANWAYALDPGAPAELQREHLRRAATAPHFDDHDRLFWSVQLEALRSSAETLPLVLRRAASKLKDDVTAEERVAYFQSWYRPVPNWSNFADACRQGGAADSSPQGRADCLAIARRVFVEARALIARLVAVSVIRRLAPGTAEARAAYELRRTYTYVSDTLDSRTPAQIARGRDHLIGREIDEVGELQAMQRLLERSGLPPEPPPDWRPANLERLMTLHERERYRVRSAALAARLVPELAPRPTPASPTAGLPAPAK
jgi:hypothetical protein